MELGASEETALCNINGSFRERVLSGGIPCHFGAAGGDRAASLLRIARHPARDGYKFPQPRFGLTSALRVPFTRPMAGFHSALNASMEGAAKITGNSRRASNLIH